MKDTVSNMVEYGGLEPVAKENPKNYYTNDYLAK
jgi:NitT/TauT family transport system substrate-binding protein